MDECVNLSFGKTAHRLDRLVPRSVAMLIAPTGEMIPRGTWRHPSNRGCGMEETIPSANVGSPNGAQETAQGVDSWAALMGADVDRGRGSREVSVSP